MTKSDSKYGDNGIARMSQKLDWDKDLKKKKIISICGIPQSNWVCTFKPHWKTQSH